MNRGIRALVLGILVADVSSAPVAAQSPDSVGPAAPRREVREQLGASVNNMGLQNSVEIGWTWPLSASRHPLLSDAHISAGVTHALTPAQTRLGGWLEYAPLSILSVRAGVDPTAYFGTFRSLMSFDSYTDPFSKKDRDARGGSRAGTGARVYVSPAVKVKAGPLVAMSSADFEWWQSSASGALFYEPTRDTLLKSRGDRLVNTTTVALFQRGSGSGGTFSIGGIHTLTHVLDAPDNRIQKLGAIAVREFRSSHFRVPRPRVTLVVARYLNDPSKQHQWSAAMAIGFTAR
ncbi:MAG: hypothetical protein A3H96_10730 [Acidobacteria bacterium RIFCSPLOWO2_02_FULL_67_36]|nr:MAG: hypothetical protein A3H96_10730 [Acidobacteria bacterium RIFCSPLOWO2_02_FULL_67_36]OFW24350.1 MAG: hypothetical protein A3G21_17440 [Acidobacteria bacterium RIFCSPLOWO2_12_FULL_66_21]